MKILFISLGCDKNLVDSEHMLGLLVKHGYEITDDETQADIIVINTCCFIHDAKEESIENILQMAEYKKQGSCKVLLVTGCMAERYREEIHQEIPEVDAVLGTNSYDRILLAIEDVLRGSHYEHYADLTGIPKTDGGRIVTTGGYYEYLKIAEGCDKHCTYCIIPKLRGSYRSVPMEELLAEAREMAAQGVRELVLVAQETTLYGTDLYGQPSLHLLLKDHEPLSEPVKLAALLSGPLPGIRPVFQHDVFPPSRKFFIKTSIHHPAASANSFSRCFFASPREICPFRTLS